MMNQVGTIGEMFPLIPIKLHNLLQKNQTYMWYQVDISLEEYRLVGPFRFGKEGRKKLKYPNMINNKQWKELEKEGRKKVINNSDIK